MSHKLDYDIIQNFILLNYYLSNGDQAGSDANEAVLNLRRFLPVTSTV